jgi:hypothetical protein
VLCFVEYGKVGDSFLEDLVLNLTLSQLGGCVVFKIENLQSLLNVMGTIPVP